MRSSLRLLPLTLVNKGAQSRRKELTHQSRRMPGTWFVDVLVPERLSTAA